MELREEEFLVPEHMGGWRQLEQPLLPLLLVLPPPLLLVLLVVAVVVALLLVLPLLLVLLLGCVPSGPLWLSHLSRPRATRAPPRGMSPSRSALGEMTCILRCFDCVRCCAAAPAHTAAGGGEALLRNLCPQHV